MREGKRQMQDSSMAVHNYHTKFFYNNLLQKHNKNDTVKKSCSIWMFKSFDLNYIKLNLKKMS